jgi:hypothetical protein
LGKTQDLLQHIDLDDYRSAQLLIARADIAQLRRQASALARTKQQCKVPTGTSRPGAELSRLAGLDTVRRDGMPRDTTPF